MTKKMIALILSLIMGLTLLTGCGDDPVAEEFEKFLNTDMVDINANYEALKAEMGNWETYATDEEFLTSLNDVILPNINESLDMLSKIELSSDEVNAIKDIYQKMLDTFKEGFELMLSGFESGDDVAVTDSLTTIEDAMGILNEYNAALEALAAEKDLVVEY